MIALLKKEVVAFFSSLTGMMVVVIFLLITGLFLWVIPGEMNVLYSGYASLEPLFYLAPWIYLFLVPAVTMHLIAEEKKSGTVELLLTSPLTELQVVTAKFFSGVVLVFISLLPTFIYFFSVYHMGAPVGNIDMGATWGSYIGLFLLAAAYVSIGVFASSLTQNQILSFVVATLLCFFFYSGIDAIASIPALKKILGFLTYMGMESHYQSISRGVVDTRDLVYFLSVIILFIVLTRLVISSRKW